MRTLCIMAVWLTACALMDTFGADFGNAYTMVLGYTVGTLVVELTKGWHKS